MNPFLRSRSTLAWLRKNSVPVVTLFTQLPWRKSAPHRRSSLCIRAQVHSCRRRNQNNLGFSPCASIAHRSDFLRQPLAALLLFCVILLTACRSYHIDVSIKNNTGGPVSLLEVDYPSASFGSDALAAGANFHYVIQTRGSAPLKVQYMGANSRQVQITGPTLYEKQEGTIEIVLTPGGKAEFHPSLNPAH